jgi:hypothetical protein
LTRRLRHSAMSTFSPREELSQTYIYIAFGQVLDSTNSKPALLLISRMPEGKIYAFDNNEI